jgi:hypothetical protein
MARVKIDGRPITASKEPVSSTALPIGQSELNQMTWAINTVSQLPPPSLGLERSRTSVTASPASQATKAGTKQKRKNPTASSFTIRGLHSARSNSVAAVRGGMSGIGRADQEPPVERDCSAAERVA